MERRITSKMGVQSIIILGREVVNKFMALGNLDWRMWLRPEANIGSSPTQPKQKSLYLQRELSLPHSLPVCLLKVQRLLLEGRRDWNAERMASIPPEWSRLSQSGLVLRGRKCYGLHQSRRGVSLQEYRSVKEN